MFLKGKFNLFRTIALMCLAVVFLCFCACSNEPVDETQPSETMSETSAQTDETAANTTSAESSLKLLADYKPYVGYDNNGDEMSVNSIYGSSYSDYGGTLSFSDDGTFTTYIGAFGNADAESGTYKFLSDTEIEMTLNTGEVRIATIVSVDNGTVYELQYFHRGFDVNFIAQ